MVLGTTLQPTATKEGMFLPSWCSAMVMHLLFLQCLCGLTRLRGSMSGWPALPDSGYPTLTNLFALKYTPCPWAWDISTGRREDVLFSRMICSLIHSSIVYSTPPMGMAQGWALVGGGGKES